MAPYTHLATGCSLSKTNLALDLNRDDEVGIWHWLEGGVHQGFVQVQHQALLAPVGRILRAQQAFPCNLSSHLKGRNSLKGCLGTAAGSRLRLELKELMILSIRRQVNLGAAEGISMQRMRVPLNIHFCAVLTLRGLTWLVRRQMLPTQQAELHSQRDP